MASGVGIERPFKRRQVAEEPEPPSRFGGVSIPVTPPGPTDQSL